MLHTGLTMNSPTEVFRLYFTIKFIQAIQQSWTFLWPTNEQVITVSNIQLVWALRSCPGTKHFSASPSFFICEQFFLKSYRACWVQFIILLQDNSSSYSSMWTNACKKHENDRTKYGDTGDRCIKLSLMCPAGTPSPTSRGRWLSQRFSLVSPLWPLSWHPNHSWWEEKADKSLVKDNKLNGSSWCHNVTQLCWIICLS